MARSDSGHLFSHAYEEARKHWPFIALSRDQFAHHLTKQVGQRNECSLDEKIFTELHLADLYLACACVHGVPEAIDVFDRDYLGKLPALFAKPKYSGAMMDEVCQQTRVHLLVHAPGSDARITQYNGRGTLMNWVCVIASRILSKVDDGGTSKFEDCSAAVLEDLRASGDTEMDYLKQHYNQFFHQALAEACSALSDDEKYLIKLHVTDGLSTVKIGVLLGKDQSTISRQLAKIRKKIYNETKRLLQERLHISNTEFESILAIVKSQLYVRVNRIFKNEGDEEDQEEDDEEEDE